MPTIKFICLLGLIFLPLACGNKQLLIKEGTTSHRGLVTQSISIEPFNVAPSKYNLLVCFSEIKAGKIAGISCQNDTGFHLFSGGLINGKFKLDKISKFLLKTKPLTVLNYIRIALFDEYSLISKSQYEIEVNKAIKKTTITDLEQKQIVELVTL